MKYHATPREYEDYVFIGSGVRLRVSRQASEYGRLGEVHFDILVGSARCAGVLTCEHPRVQATPSGLTGRFVDVRSDPGVALNFEYSRANLSLDVELHTSQLDELHEFFPGSAAMRLKNEACECVEEAIIDEWDTAQEGIPRQSVAKLPCGRAWTRDDAASILARAGSGLRVLALDAYERAPGTLYGVKWLGEVARSIPIEQAKACVASAPAQRAFGFILIDPGARAS